VSRAGYIPHRNNKKSMRLLVAHLIFSAYGFWLPNDPRGSWSEWVAAWELFRFGKATKVNHGKSVASAPHDANLRRAAKKALKYPPVLFNGIHALGIAKGFARAAQEAQYPIHACSILPDHVHLVIGYHERPFQQITSHLKSHASRQLRAEGLHPFTMHERPDGSLPSVWAESLWKVYCFDRQHAMNAIEYVKQNPVREGKRRQSWSFVTPFAE
jgi:REP element-mobilizing transposase RayT